MNEQNKLSSVLMVPCAKCGALNRVEVEYKVTPAKTITKEVERQKLEEEAQHEGEQTSIGPEGKRVRPDAPKGEPVERSADDKPSNPTGKPVNQEKQGGKK